MCGVWPVHAIIPVVSSNAGPDAIETEVTNEVDALGLCSRSGLGSVENSRGAPRIVGSLTALDCRFASREVPAAASHHRRPLAFLARAHEGKGPGVEVKIGVTDSPRELIFNSAQTPSEVEKLITD